MGASKITIYGMDGHKDSNNHFMMKKIQKFSSTHYERKNKFETN